MGQPEVAGSISWHWNFRSSPASTPSATFIAVHRPSDVAHFQAIWWHIFTCKARKGIQRGFSRYPVSVYYKTDTHTSTSAHHHDNTFPVASCGIKFIVIPRKCEATLSLTATVKSASSTFRHPTVSVVILAPFGTSRSA